MQRKLSYKFKCKERTKKDMPSLASDETQSSVENKVLTLPSKYVKHEVKCLSKDVLKLRPSLTPAQADSALALAACQKGHVLFWSICCSLQPLIFIQVA